MLRHVHRLRVRYHECDPQGVVFNAHYLAFCDMGVTELWRAGFGGYDEMVRRGIDMVVAEATIAFRAPARFDELVDIAAEVAELGTTSMITTYELTREEAAGESTLLATGRLRHVFMDASTMTKTPIPDWIRDVLSAPAPA